MKRGIGQLPFWRRAITVVLIPFVLAVIVLLFVLVSAWNVFAYGKLWLRWKLKGVPIPPMSPPPEQGPGT